MELGVGGKYKFIRRVGEGSFGEIYQGLNIQTGDECAIKLESNRTKHPQLLYESKIYRILQGGEGLHKCRDLFQNFRQNLSLQKITLKNILYLVGIPNLHWYGFEGEYNIMVIDLLGPSLEEFFRLCGKQFTLKTVLMIADQLLTRIEYFHSKDFIHRDIKPDNFLVGRSKVQDKIFLIDYGLAKKYRDPRTGKHIPYKTDKSFVGTMRYTSLNTDDEIEPSRRDDLESIGYVLIYFLKGELPWQGIKASSKEGKQQITLQKKAGTTLEELCKGIPEAFYTYMRYVRNLRFEDKPNYNYLRKLFKDLFWSKYSDWDLMYDWIEVHKNQRIKPKDPMKIPDLSDKGKANNTLPSNSNKKPPEESKATDQKKRPTQQSEFDDIDENQQITSNVMVSSNKNSKKSNLVLQSDNLDLDSNYYEDENEESVQRQSSKQKVKGNQPPKKK